MSKDSALSQETLASHRKHANQYVMRAFQLNNKNPIVALEMGKRFFDKGQYDKVGSPSIW